MGLAPKGQISTVFENLVQQNPLDKKSISTYFDTR